MYNPTSLAFGDVLDKQYEPQEVEWYHDPVTLAHLANASLQKVLYRDPNSGALHEQPNAVPEAMGGPDAERWRESMEKEIVPGLTFFKVSPPERQKADHGL